MSKKTNKTSNQSMSNNTNPISNMEDCYTNLTTDFSNSVGDSSYATAKKQTNKTTNCKKPCDSDCPTDCK